MVSALTKMPSPSNESSAKKVKRTYVACVPCRKRKVKCEIIASPPCAKCEREHRECTFRNTEMTVKHREAPFWVRKDTQSSSHNTATLSTSPIPVQENTLRSEEANMTDLGINQVDADNQPHEPSTSWRNDQVMSTVMTQPRHALEALFTAARTAQIDPRPEYQNILTPGTTFDLESRLGFSAPSPLSQPADSVLDTWDKFRFVRQGWFSAQEAVTYVDLFYQNLAPLCPLNLDKWRDHNNHEALLTQEAMLCATILATSSRFHVLAGPGGYSRGQHIHNKLWQHCERLIQRLMLGQEKTSSAKIRCIGTIEALILISDWQPRAVHFPPDTDGWDVSFLPRSWGKRDRVARDGGTSFARWQEDVFEPAKRSDRMSWMLLGAAMNLLSELASSADDCGDRIRYLQTRTVLGIYVAQIASRLGIASTLPLHPGDDMPPNTDLTSSNQGSRQEPYWNELMAKWTELVNLEKTASIVFFRSSTHVKQTIADGRHTDVVRHFLPSLELWDSSISSSNALPLAMKHLLQIQFYHLRILIRAISLQAVVNRLSTFRAPYELPQPDMNPAQDHKSVRELVSDCHAVLKITVDLATTGVLRYCPSRSLISITSASVFLLKAISIGCRISELKESLDVLEQAIRALKSAPIDDMDFAARYASLIDEHAKQFRSNFKFSHTTRQNSPLQGSHDASDPSGHMEKDSDHQQHTTHDLTAEDGFNADSIGPFVEEWWSQPFDPAVAPFDMSNDHIAWGLDLGSLDFLWNLSS